MTWNKAFVFGWVAILGILIAYELYAVFTGKNDPPLTWVTVRYIPGEITLTFLFWLFVHFALRYANTAYVEMLRTGK